MEAYTVFSSARPDHSGNRGSSGPLSCVITRAQFQIVLLLAARPEWKAIGLPDIMTLSTPFKMIYLQDFEF